MSEDRVWIPEVPGDRLLELAGRIKPVIRFKNQGKKKKKRDPGGDPHYLKPEDIFAVAYTWDPKPALRADGLVSIGEITTHHSFNYPGFFKPSVAEVLAQIPPDKVDQVVAFEIVAQPEMADDLNRHKEALNAGYHVATTRLYAAAA